MSYNYNCMKKTDHVTIILTYMIRVCWHDIHVYIYKLTIFQQIRINLILYICTIAVLRHFKVWLQYKIAKRHL